MGGNFYLRSGTTSTAESPRSPPTLSSNPQPTDQVLKGGRVAAVWGRGGVAALELYHCLPSLVVLVWLGWVGRGWKCGPVSKSGNLALLLLRCA